jgi:hypothetical protein
VAGVQAATRAPVTPWALGAFFIFATAMSLLAGVTLLFPGTQLDAVWRVKPAEYAELRALGPWVGGGFLAMAIVGAWGARGAFQQRRWGWRLAIVALAVNGLADAARIPFGAVLEGLVGVSVTGTLLWWLTRPRVRALFDR